MAEAARLKDWPQLAACYAPPFDQVLADVLKSAQRHDAAIAKLHEAACIRWDPEKDLPGTALDVKRETFSPFHELLSGVVKAGDAKTDPKWEKATAVLTVEKDTDGCEKLGYPVVLVHLKDDWRLVFDEEPWVAGTTEVAAKVGIDLGRALEKAATDHEKLAQDVNAAAGEGALTKEAAAERFSAAAGKVKAALAAFRGARAAASNAEKEKAAAADKAAQDKLAQEKAAADKAAADKAAADKAVRDKAAAEKAAAEKAALEKLAQERAEKEAARRAAAGEKPASETPAPPRGDSTGTLVVLVLIGLVGVGVVGYVIVKAREQGGGRPGKGGGPRSGRGPSGRSPRSPGSSSARRRPPGKR